MPHRFSRPMHGGSALALVPAFALALACQGCGSKEAPANKAPKSAAAKSAAAKSAGTKSAAPASKAGRKPRRGKRRGPPGQEETFNTPYVGVTTDGTPAKGLFPIKATGVSTAPIVNAAQAFLAGLTPEQRSKTRFPVDDLEWRKWSNVDNGIYARAGVSLKAMNPEQKALAIGLLRASLSAHGLEQAQGIMKTDKTLSEFNNNSAHLDEELYFFTIMGTPSTTDPWGWQIDGHHLVINYFVLGDQVVFAPAFMGAEPARTTTGKHKGNVLLQAEQDLGLKLMQALPAAQQKQATIGEMGRGRFKSGAGADNLKMPYEGLAAKDMAPEHKQMLLAIIKEYVRNLRDGHAKVKLSAVREHLDATRFAWRGGVADDAVFYYRIHSPVILIEFDHQAPVALPNPSRSRAPIRDHIHTMIRTPNGNDYGRDLLRQHLETHHRK